MTGPWHSLIAAAAMVLFGISVQIGFKGGSPLTVVGALPSVMSPHPQNSIDVSHMAELRTHGER